MRTKQRKEAIKRMNKLGIDERVIKKFADEGTLFYSNIFMNYLATDFIQKKAKEIEESTNGLVYFATQSFSIGADMISFFYVSAEEHEWEDDNELFEENLQYCYVHNLHIPEFSEIGMIKYQTIAGGIKRIM